MKKLIGHLRSWLDRLAPPESTFADPATATEDQSEEKIGHQSLFDLMKDCADLLTQLEDMDEKLDAKAKPLAEHLRVTLQEMLERAGAMRIEEETAFDVTRHQVIPARRVKTGEQISETLEPGYLFDRRVLKRARVRV